MRNAVRHPLKLLSEWFRRFVVIDNAILAAAEGDECTDSYLRTVDGQVIPLKQRDSFETLQRTFSFQARDVLQHRFTIPWVVGILLPQIAGSEFGDEHLISLDDFLQSLPGPEIPTPSLWSSESGFRLQLDKRRTGRTQVVYRGDVLGTTNEQWSIHSLEERWKKKIAVEVNAALTPASRSRVADARRQVAESGFYQQGRFLFLKTDALVGYVLEPHFNYTLKRHCNDDVAIMLPLDQWQIEELLIYEKVGSRWRQVPHWVCVGGVPSNDRIDLIEYLRLAADHYHSKCAFHEHHLPGNLWS